MAGWSVKDGTRSPLVISALKRATTSVPIVMTENLDPVGMRFVASLAQPGGNITGTTDMEVELTGKRLQLLKELVPRLRRVAVIHNPSNPANMAAWRVAESMAPTLGIQAFAVDIKSPDQIDTDRANKPQSSAVAQFERDVLRERTVAGLAAAKRRGERFGRRPALTPAQVREAKAMVKRGDSPSHVARILRIGRSTLYRALQETR